MELYVSTCNANNVSQKGCKTYANYLLKYFGSNKDILKIDSIAIDKLKLHMLSENKSPATINRYLSALRRAYNILIENGTITYNPVKNKMLKENNRRSRILSHEEWEILQDFLQDEIIDIVTLAINTGLRKSNILNLKWEQIDLEQRLIKIEESKNKGRKLINKRINDTAFKILNKYDNTSGYVFINPNTGKPYLDIKVSFKNALKKAGIENFKFHDLRRTMATWLHNEGVPLRVIQDLLDHSDISTTERYLALSKEQSNKAIDILDNFM